MARQVGTASVANRQVFYNRSTSTIFGNGAGNPINAIDATKTALLPGQATTLANYTNYNRGLKGLIVDVANVSGLVSASDFQFATWDGISAASFTATAATATVTVIPNGGNAACPPSYTSPIRRIRAHRFQTKIWKRPRLFHRGAPMHTLQSLRAWRSLNSH